MLENVHNNFMAALEKTLQLVIERHQASVKVTQKRIKAPSFGIIDGMW